MNFAGVDAFNNAGPEESTICLSESSDDESSSGEEDLELLQLGDTTPSPTKSALKREKRRLWHEKRILLEKNLCKTFSILRFVDDSKSIKFYTGFKNYQVLYAMFEFFNEDSQKMHYLGSTYKNSEDLDWSETSTNDPKGKPRSLSKMDEFFMCMVRLRQNYEVFHIGNLFGLSAGQVSRIVNTWIMLMSDRLGQLNFWQSRPSEKSHLLPSDAKEALKELKIIIDATEIKTEKPSSTRAQKEIFSPYKNNTTAKCLVGIDANGVIAYYSRVYAGRTSDKKMIMHCGILELLQPGDVIMADRGFDIAAEMESLGIGVVIPDFLTGKVQFSHEELQHSEKVAQIRVHVERAIRKIKEFKIVKDELHLSMAPMIDKIWTCCAVLSNFTGTGFLVKPK